MIALREYQLAAIEQARAKLREGKRAPLLVAPTGAGKTVIIAELVRLHLELDPSHRALVVAHRRELVLQAGQTIRRMTGLDVGEIHPASEPRPQARIQVASTQTLRARGEHPPATLVVYDEAHHYSSDDWSLLTTAYGDTTRVGFTATPCRSDGRGLSPAFDSLVVVASIKQLTALGFLVPCRVVAPEKPLRSGQIAQWPVDAYLEHCKGRKTVVFARTVAEAVEFADQFGAKGIRAAVVHGNLPTIERNAAFREHAQGAVLVNCQILTEGWDSPETSACILARGCGSVGTYLQIVGRVLRPSPGKSNAVLVDLSGAAFHAHGPPDEDRVYALDGKGIRSKTGDEVFCPVCGALVDEWPCVSCGHQPAAGAAPLKVTGDTLAERYEAKRAEDDDKRTETLARWFAEARANGHRVWAARYKFRSVYGHEPPTAVADRAMALSHSIECATCASCGRKTARTYASGKCGKCRYGSAA